MGRRMGPNTPRASGLFGPAARVAELCLAACAALLLVQAPARAQPANPAPTLQERLSSTASATQKAGPTERMLVRANEMVYDRDKDTVEARGDAQLYYEGRILQADMVKLDRKANRLTADGHVKLTNEDGTVTYANHLDLTNDFRDGFIDTLRVNSSEATQLTGARAERLAGDTTVLERGTYAACTPCAADSSKSPFWQIKAKRIIHNNDERMIYFEDAELEFLGVPVAYAPFFSMADPSVTRKSGILSPGYYPYNTTLGFGLTGSLYWAIAPNYDLTVTPTFYTRQGLYLQTEWRHQLVNGSYDIRLSGVFQNDPTAFAPPPTGPGNQRFRGYFESAGKFLINEKWSVGWDVNLVSDKWFIQNYRLPSDIASANFFRETTTTAFLHGQDEHGYFDLRGYYFQGLSQYDLQDQQPLVAPVLDYDKIFDLDPAKTAGVGGRVEIDANVTHISRSLAAFQSTGARTLDSAYNLYDVCTVYVPGKCLVRGIGGDYTRATINASWKRQIIDPMGEVWTPFLFSHVNGSFVEFNQNRSDVFTSTTGTPPVTMTSTITNASQQAFFGPGADATSTTATPGAGLEYRFPFVMENDWATHTFEPIAQIIVRPNAPASAALINEDSQSLVFDDSSLFEWNKYSGYDRFEGGTRANYGAQYTMTFKSGAYANFLIGQSTQVAGQNSYATPDAANIGLSSGLDKRNSDIVSRFAFSTDPGFAFVAKGRFDPTTLAIRRLDLTSTARLGSLEASLQYARYTAQPLIGFDRRREGLSAAFKYKLDQGYFATSSVVFDMSRHLYDSLGNIRSATPLFFPAGFGVGVGYADPDTQLGLNYTSLYQDNGNGLPVRNQTVMVELKLRTLGAAKFSTSLGNIAVQDGLSSATQ